MEKQTEGWLLSACRQCRFELTSKEKLLSHKGEKQGRGRNEKLVSSKEGEKEGRMGGRKERDRDCACCGK